MQLYSDIIKVKSIDISLLRAKTQRAIKAYEDTAVKQPENKEKLEDLNETIIDDLIAYLSSIEPPTPKKQKGFFESMHDSLY